MKGLVRADGRSADALRPMSFQAGIAGAAPGSVLVSMGRTQVLCGVSIENGVPRWMRRQKVSGGWVTAEYSMLPYSTRERTRRETQGGRPGGRTQEIQRMIGRSMRAVVDLEKLGARTLWVDCDVLQADGGTRTASITGAYVALRLAVNNLLDAGLLEADPVREAVAAVSVGLVEALPMLDLCYTEDLAAEVDMNVVMTASGKLVEVQGAAEGRPFSRTVFNRMLGLAATGIRQLVAFQQKALNG